MLCCILFAALFSSCASSRQANYTFNKKYGASELREEFSLLKKILEANHPSLYWYTTKDSLDKYFIDAINSIQDSLTESDYRKKVASVIEKIKCGHTFVRYSKAYTKEAFKYRYPQFPLYLKVWDDSLVVLGSVIHNDSVFKRGTIVTSINGSKPKQILDAMFDVISTDGYNKTYKEQVVTNNFPAWYRNVYGADSIYHITYIDSNEHEAATVVSNFKPKRDTSTKKNPIVKISPEPTRKQLRQMSLLSKRSMGIDTGLNTAFIRLTTFSSGHLRNFFKKSFKTIEEQHIKNVVIDLRENGGGNVVLSNKLAKYLADRPFKIADTLAAISRTFPYRQYIRPWYWYWFPMNFVAHKKKDGRIHFTYYEKHYFTPKKHLHFDGDVYILQGGLTFSASTMFTSILKGQKNVTVVGEESGGGYYGNTAMYLLDIILPVTKIRVELPMYRLVMDVKRDKDGRGIMPDILIKPSTEAIKQGIDLKIKAVRELIQQKH
jgi:C-terminal processing protease CtpA/Prc